MEPLIVLAIALAVFAVFVLITAYILKSAIAFNSLRSGSAHSEKDIAEEALTHDKEEE